MAVEVNPQPVFRTGNRKRYSRRKWWTPNPHRSDELGPGAGGDRFFIISVPIGDGGNPSPLGEARFGVTWSRAALPDGRAHEERPEGPSSVDTEISESGIDRRVALRVRDLLRQIAVEHELEIVSGKVARDHVHLLLSYRTNQGVSQIVQWLKGISSRVLLQEFPHLRKKFWGRHLWARGYLTVSSGTITDEMIREYIEEQEGEQIADDSRFPIDST